MLTLSTKIRYATRILAFLASRPLDEAVSARAISEAEGVSFDYVEQILLRLKAANLVRSRRGAGGGFTLAREPETMTVTDVISAIEGEVNIIPCLSEKCGREGRCPTRSLWQRANDALTEVFSGTTIADLANGDAQDAMAALDYQI